jgi:uncharacterized protein YeaO (DUF488 family)
MYDGAMVRIKRVFEKKSLDDGYRVLVDRLWPRGIRKESAALNYWAKELAPSEELREFYHHDPKRWGLFQAKFRAELMKTLADLSQRARTETVTLVFGSREPVMNNATVVKDLLDIELARGA